MTLNKQKLRKYFAMFTQSVNRRLGVSAAISKQNLPPSDGHRLTSAALTSPNTNVIIIIIYRLKTIDDDIDFNLIRTESCGVIFRDMMSL